MPVAARRFADTVHQADATIWSSPIYHGSVSGAFKNALDSLILLADSDPPYLSNEPIGLVATAGGQGLQAVNLRDFIARALPGWAVPLVLPVAVFRPDGRLKDESVARHSHALGAEVVRAALQFRQDGSCGYAEVRQFTSGSLDARSGAQTPRPEGLGTGHGSTVPPPPHCLALAEPLGQIGRPPPLGAGYLAGPSTLVPSDDQHEVLIFAVTPGLRPPHGPRG